MVEDYNASVSDLIEGAGIRAAIDVKRYVSDDVG